jgi:hypothetical protein
VYVRHPINRLTPVATIFIEILAPPYGSPVIIEAECDAEGARAGA